jgi:hypothetical protein
VRQDSSLFIVEATNQAQRTRKFSA